MPLPVYLIHYRASDWCRSATDSILASDLDVSLTVVNNGGELDLDPRVTVLQSPNNRGYSGGANQALRRWLTQDEPYCVVGSHDLHVEVDTLRLLVAAADQDASFGILGPRLTTNWVGPLLGEVPGIEIRREISGTCLLLRRACIDDIGLFDETFKSYGEDNEICLRAGRAGWRVGRVLAAEARGVGTRHESSRQLNSMANSILVAWHRDGAAGLKRRYRTHFRSLRQAVRGEADVEARVVATAVVLGTARLVAGILRSRARRSSLRP